ncbi:nicotinate-nucleotide adenylyltransferase [bacterium]|nr:nicotinate-nucleotide adenylyltransferase [bacterium]
MTEPSMPVIALMGGTFDPVHVGHVQSANALLKVLPSAEVRLLPCCIPAHRALPGVTGEHRLAMLQLACEETELLVDDSELRREGVSYSIDTVEQLRAERGPDVSIVWVMGGDAFLQFDQWHRWQDFLLVAHIIVLQRPGFVLPVDGVVGELLSTRRADKSILTKQSAGAIVPLTLKQYPVSATDVRSGVVAGRDVSDAVLPSVLNYIHQYQLYI